MRDNRARTRIGLSATASRSSVSDPRIHVDFAHLRGLEGQAKALSFLPRQPAVSVLNGRHASRLRGRGLNFEELRDYLPGDDIRTIDWRVTARKNKPHTKVFREERERPTLIVVDQTQNMFFGSRLRLKSVAAAEVAARIAWQNLNAGDRVGGIVIGLVAAYDEIVGLFGLVEQTQTHDDLAADIRALGDQFGVDADSSDDVVDGLVERRAAAREARDWGTADAIRNGLGEIGITIEDVRDGARWHRR